MAQVQTSNGVVSAYSSNDPETLRSLPIEQLLRKLADETSTLVRQELALARVELVEKGKAAGTSAAMFSASALLGIGAFGALTLCIIAAIALALPYWAAALIVAVVYGGIAAVMARRGQQEFTHALPLIPEQTAQTLKDDVECTKTRIESGRK